MNRHSHTAAPRRRRVGTVRRVGAAVAGAVLAMSLAGCSMDWTTMGQTIGESVSGDGDTLTDTAVPTALEIPSIGVDQDLIDLEIQDDGTLEVPANGEDIGWYSPDDDPTDGYPTVFVAHVDTPAGPAVFGRLLELVPGDEVEVSDGSGDARVYRVDRIEDHPVDDFPTFDVYGTVEGDEIRLMTCNGEFDTVRQRYEENRVVYASVVG